MGTVRLSAFALVLAVATPARANEVERWHPQIAEASLRFGVPSSWIERVMRAESGGHTSLNGRAIRSPKGAIGLMQLMPGTWAQLRAELGLGRNPDDPRDNILAGTAYLRRLYDRFGYPGLFAAYNAGPERYAQHLSGRPLPPETRAYLAALGVSSSAVGQADRPGLFALHEEGIASPTPDESAPPIDPMFAIRRDGHR